MGNLLASPNLYLQTWLASAVSYHAALAVVTGPVLLAVIVLALRGGENKGAVFGRDTAVYPAERAGRSGARTLPAAG